MSIIFTLLEDTIGIKALPKVIPVRYLELKSLFPVMGSGNLYSVGVYSDKSKNKIIIKKLIYRFPNIIFNQIKNEAVMLRILNKYNNQSPTNAIFPQVKKLIVRKNTITLHREYIRGRTLKSFSKKVKINMISQSLDAILHISAILSENDIRKFSRRSSFQIAASFPYFAIRALVREPQEFRSHMKYFLLFYISYLLSNPLKTTYSICHRDLHSNNLFKVGKKVAIIDPAIMVLSEKGTDLALIPLLYFSELTIPILRSFLHKRLRTKKELYKFTELAIFYAMQLKATQPKEGIDYKNASLFLLHLSSDIIPFVVNKIGGSHFYQSSCNKTKFSYL